MYCTNCGKEIKDGSIFCSECGQKINVPAADQSNEVNASPVQPIYPQMPPVYGMPQQPDNNKLGKNRKKTIIIAVVAAVLVIAVIITVLIMLNRKNKKDEETSTDQSEASSEETVDTKEYQTGDSVKVGNLSYTVNSAYSSQTLPDYDENLRTEGMFLTVNLTVENNGEDTALVDSSLFVVEDKDKNPYELNNEMNDTTVFNYGIEAGESSDYSIVYDLPEDSNDYTLKVRGGTESDNYAVIDLAIEPAPAEDTADSDTDEDYSDSEEDYDASNWIGTWNWDDDTDEAGSTLTIGDNGDGTLSFYFDAYAGDHVGQVGGNLIVDSDTSVYQDEDEGYTITFTYYGDYITVVTSDDFFGVVGEGVVIDGDYSYSDEAASQDMQNDANAADEEDYAADGETGEDSTNRYFNENYNTATGSLMFSPREVYYEDGQLVAVMYIYNGYDSIVNNISNLSISIGDGAETIAEADFDPLDGMSIESGNYITWTFTFTDNFVKIKDADLSYLETNANCNVAFED